VTRFITVATIFSDLSPLELGIFLKKYYALLLLLYFLRDQLHTSNVCTLLSTTTYVTRFITLLNLCDKVHNSRLFSDLTLLNYKFMLTNVIFLTIDLIKYLIIHN
jgi:hypothetical protein